MRMRALCTEMLSMIESGRAKYTYSKMHGVWRAVADALLRVQAPVLVDDTPPRPAPTSRTSSKPSMSSATLSEASMHSAPFGVSRWPSTSGRMPCGSRNPSMPWPMIIATTA